MPFYAHSPNEQGEWHELETHLRETARLSSRFAQKFGAGELGRIAALWHDIGKFSDSFQDYLKAVVVSEQTGQRAPQRGSVDHSSAGALLASERKADYPAIVIAAHHTGLSNRAALQERLYRKSSDSDVRDSIGTAVELKLVETVPDDFAALLPGFIKTGDKSQTEFFLRMLFSALVDADCLDTEAHCMPEKSQIRSYDYSVEMLWHLFKTNQDALIARADDTPLNRARREMYEACSVAADRSQGIFSLSVPTGGGKTRAGMGFALKHAICHGLDRVIVAIPYTSIIEQNAKVYRSIFGDRPVLEHHSAVEVRKKDEFSYAALAAQNWDVPIVVTTTVQLFESLFHNRRGHCRKLHNIARSVLVLDEVQTLPIHLLEPILDVLQELVDHYEVTVVLCTATQPAFEGQNPYLKGLQDVQEIIADPHRYFAELKRVEYEMPCLESSWTWQRVADEMQRHEQCLAVVNTRRDALELLDELADPDALHLSTLLCGADRRSTLDTVRYRLKQKLPCHLVSTQVVEAGVDVDFPFVMRAFGPLDRIVQVAGRCNREGQMQTLGRVVVFKPESGRAPRGAYRTAMAEAEKLLRFGMSLHDPGLFREYFRLLYQDVDTDKHGIQHLRERLDFQKAAEQFQMIEQATTPAVVHCPGHEHEIDSLISRARYGSGMTRALWQKLQPYIVNIYQHDIEKYRTQGICEPTELGFDLWKGQYDAVRGLRDVARDPADLLL